MLTLHKTFNVRIHLPALRISDASRMNTDASGDQRLQPSPFENPIRSVWGEIEQCGPHTQEELTLLKSAYFATFSDDY